ncbi:coiled-coil domain-containing protein 28B-like isoform X2 [Amphiura filiformis]|uniref:coiled-coil domain-containing protein 28B-like isoform X2 n=1 Tax=Amphiura filiformis TaxID=82378 RepID=UPI003B2205C2
MDIGKVQRPGSLASQSHHQSALSQQSTRTTRQGSRHSAKRKTKNAELDLDRPCKEHSFITDINDVRNMQEGLLKLLDDFDSGRVQAFDAHCSFEKMDNIRDLQEKLARTHFQMDAQLRAKGGNTQEAMELASSNMDHLLSNLDQLSIAIRSLHPPRDEDDVFVSQPR